MARKRRPEIIISHNAELVKTVVDEQRRQIALHDSIVTYLFSIMVDMVGRVLRLGHGQAFIFAQSYFSYLMLFLQQSKPCH